MLSAQHFSTYKSLSSFSSYVFFSKICTNYTCFYYVYPNSDLIYPLNCLICASVYPNCTFASQCYYYAILCLCAASVCSFLRLSICTYKLSNCFYRSWFSLFNYSYWVQSLINWDYNQSLWFLSSWCDAVAIGASRRSVRRGGVSCGWNVPSTSFFSALTCCLYWLLVKFDIGVGRCYAIFGGTFGFSLQTQKINFKYKASKLKPNSKNTVEKTKVLPIQSNSISENSDQQCDEVDKQFESGSFSTIWYNKMAYEQEAKTQEQDGQQKTKLKEVKEEEQAPLRRSDLKNYMKVNAFTSAVQIETIDMSKYQQHNACYKSPHKTFSLPITKSTINLRINQVLQTEKGHSYMIQCDNTPSISKIEKNLTNSKSFIDDSNKIDNIIRIKQVDKTESLKLIENGGILPNSIVKRNQQQSLIKQFSVKYSFKYQQHNQLPKLQPKSAIDQCIKVSQPSALNEIKTPQLERESLSKLNSNNRSIQMQCGSQIRKIQSTLDYYDQQSAQKSVIHNNLQREVNDSIELGSMLTCKQIDSPKLQNNSIFNQQLNNTIDSNNETDMFDINQVACNVINSNIENKARKGRKQLPKQNDEEVMEESDTTKKAPVWVQEQLDGKCGVLDMADVEFRDRKNVGDEDS